MISIQRRLYKGLLVVPFTVFAFVCCYAQDPEKPAAATTAPAAATSALELTKKLNNPVASLISVPFQNNTDVGIGKYNGYRNTTNFQPVVPISLSANLNLITRVVVPIVTQYNMYSEGTRQSGISDALASVFFSPANSKNGLTWGAGPAFLIPTATNDLLGTKKFGVGPTAVLLEQTHGWTLGALVNQIWSVAGDDDRADVNQLYMQPFIAHNWKSGAGLGVSAEITRNWEADVTTAYIIPSISGITRIGTQTVQLNMGPRIHVAAPEGRKPDYGIRASVTLVFPK